MDNNKIGKYIAKLRKKKGLTQQQLGDKLFVTDKAVSKWERGLSLPDITILEKLSETLDTDIYDILQMENKKSINIDKILEDEKKKINKQITKKILIITIPVFIIISIILFKLIPFGYNVEHYRYTHNDNKMINLGIPKFSFHMKNSENNYSYKSFRSKSILKSELKAFTNTLDHISCNDTTYYYDNTTDVTIVDYNVNGNIIYNTISYTLKNGNYCNTLEIKEYQEKLGVLDGFKTLDIEESNIQVRFLNNLRIVKGKNEWTAALYIYYTGENNNKVLEKSSGTFKVIDNELIYTRNTIEEKDDNLEIPTISSFVLKKHKLILKDNYLNNYKKSIILK